MLYLAKSVEIYQQILNLFNNDSEETFNKVSLEVFMTQATHNPVYRRFLSLINCRVDTISHYRDIPLMPISFFKKYSIKTFDWNPEKTFLSSGTTSTNTSQRSKHNIKSIDWYNNITQRIFENEKGIIENFEVLALLPSYIENGDSSLVHMVSNFQKLSGTLTPASYLYNHEELASRIKRVLEQSNQSVLLFGVTYALLDFAAIYPIHSDKLGVIFTGGMKNKRVELSYQDVKMKLSESFPLSKIYAEYGMTELLSQAYSGNSDSYNMPATMRIITKEMQDPQTNSKLGKTGMIGIIDLANYDSCSFILTDDLGMLDSPRSFKVLGRLDASDLRGCNLLYNPK